MKDKFNDLFGVIGCVKYIEMGEDRVGNEIFFKRILYILDFKLHKDINFQSLLANISNIVLYLKRSLMRNKDYLIF